MTPGGGCQLKSATGERPATGATAGVKAYSERPKVLGTGQMGAMEDTRHSPGYNCCIFAALPDEQAESAVARLQRFADEFEQQFDRPTQLRVFVVPCRQVI